MYRQLLNTYVDHSTQLELNKKSPVGERWCNFLCQKYVPSIKFYTKQAGKNMCMECSRMLTTTKKYIKDKRITTEQFKNDPNIIKSFNKKPINNTTLQCCICKITKNIYFFDTNRNTCKKCRLEQSAIRIKKRIKEDIDTIEEYKINEQTLKQFIKTLPVNEIFNIMKHYGITRKATDKKDDVIFKLIQYFRQLQDPYKCMGNCGFSLNYEFTICESCNNNTKQSIEEKNHKFKENLPLLMEDLYEITEEDMYKYNSFCIRSIAEYLDINMFKTKTKGDTKEKMVRIINAKLESNKEKNNIIIEQKIQDLEINGVVILCRYDGYINATKICQAGGKKINHWNVLDSTKNLIKALSAETGIPVSALIDIKKGGNDKNLQGSWIHPDLGVQLAQWISPIFSLKVSKWVRELAMTGSVVLRHEKTSEELMVMQKKYKKLEKNHDKLLEKRKYYKFKQGSVYYIISDMESNCVKFKPGFEGVDINVRLSQHRSTTPGIKLEMLIYSGTSECKLLESSMLQRYSGKRKHINHEWIYDVVVEHIKSSTTTLLEFLGIQHVIEKDIEKYNNRL